MKNLLVFAVALASVNAFATRARYTALAGAPHLADTQVVYYNPAVINGIGGDYVTIESGNSANTTGSDSAEGMVVRSMGDSKFGLSLGQDSSSVFGLRTNSSVPASIRGSSKLNQQQNPIGLTYGSTTGGAKWAGTLVYSNYNDKKNDAKENSLGLRAGALMGNMDVSARLGLGSEASSGTDKFKGTTSVSVGAGYMMDGTYFFGDISMAGFKAETAGTETAKYDTTSIYLTATNVMMKDTNMFFYGAGLKKVDTKESVADKKSSTLTLPVWLGFETDATSWLVVRGSLTQTVLINDSKDETAGTTTAETSPGENNTTAAMGVGLKFNKLTIDGTLKGLVGTTTQNQQIDGSNLLATVGATYLF